MIRNETEGQNLFSQLTYRAAHRSRPGAPEPDEVQQRDLGAYDAAFGLTEEVP